MSTGCGTALVTPFRPDRSLDDLFYGLCKASDRRGHQFSGALRYHRRKPHADPSRASSCRRDHRSGSCGRVPVLAGAGGYDTAKTIQLIAELKSIGVSGILSVTPYYNKPTQDGLYQHFRSIAESTSLPIIVYSVQSRTAVNIEPATVARLSEIDNIVGIKEASGSISQMASILACVSELFLVLSGDDSVTLPLIALGGRGVISVVSNQIPTQFSQLTRAALNGDFARAQSCSGDINADRDQFRRDESRASEICDGTNGSSQTRMAAAHGSSAGRVWERMIETVLESLGLLSGVRV